VTRFKSYRKRKSYALAILIILLALFISISSLRDLFGMRSLLQAVIYPFQFISVSVWKSVTGIPGSVMGLRGLSEHNKQYQNELEELRLKLQVFEEIKSENQRLREALGYKQKNSYKYKLLAAQVIGRAPSPWFTILEIGRGGQSGVKKGMAVITEKGGVGQVIEVSVFSSKVLLLIDPDGAIAAVNSRSRDIGVVAGAHTNKLFMKYVSVGGDIKEGDSIVTSHISGIFPPGIPIGEVTHASKKEQDLFYQIEIKPYVDFSKIEEVFVVF
jgi:rod shape-determining protein MreC